MKNFNALGLPQPLLAALGKMQFTTPTPIQAQAIPTALEGRDILGSAQTGTGKTAAFAIPMLAHLMNNPQSGAIVMTPTRELAAQVAEAINQMLDGSRQIKTALLIGGQSMGRQHQQLRNRARIIVGTPGRINDHLQQGSLKLHATDFLVLDETDRMLDMGFDVQIERIVRKLPEQRQTLLFSATLPARIVKMAEKYQKNPERIAVGSTHTPIERIRQELVHLSTADKYSRLLTHLEQRKGSIIVFVRTKRGADRLAGKLNKAQFSADAIHGNLSQNQRNRVIQSFRDKRHRVMVATDVAARGLDIPHIEHVINYDLPQCPEDYIHRIGRTARAGAEGEAVCFITPEDNKLWRDIHFLMNPKEKSERTAPPTGKSRKARGKKPYKPYVAKGEGDAPGKKPFDRSKKKRRFEKDRPARAERNGRNDRDNGNASFERSDRFDRANRQDDRSGRGNKGRSFGKSKPQGGKRRFNGDNRYDAA
ncbi:MAG: DEAD/DEAH box helicase [Alphaproteobacteria bacterium]|nr:DEAD/DEAH box helicase [Alphaproteobacteria bacterium]